MPSRMGFWKVSPEQLLRGEGRGGLRSQEAAAEVLSSVLRCDRVSVTWGRCGFVLHGHSLALSRKVAGGLRLMRLIQLMPFTVRDLLSN